MELEGSFLCSQEPTTGLYSDPDQSNPHLPTLTSSLILYLHLLLDLPSGSSLQVFQPKFMYFSSPPFVLHVPPT